MRFVLGLVLLLGGCAAPMVQSTGKVCVADSAAVGDRVWMIEFSSYGVITELLGRSRECTNSEIPVLAVAKAS